MPRRDGFTFVEILVVMAVLGALAAIAVPRYRSFRERAWMAAMRSDLGNVRVAQEEHWALHLRYATDTASLGFGGTSEVSLTLRSGNDAGGYSAYATHSRLPGVQCATFAGMDAVSVPSGEIICGPVPAGSGTLPGRSP